MTHDPLCPYFPEQQGFGGINSGVPSTQPYIAGVPCQCDLIARVREDEQSHVIGSVSLAAIGEANMQQYRNGYAAALRDAVEEVKLSCSADIELVERSEVIAAIEALGGDR